MKKFLESPNTVFLLVLPVFLIGMYLGSFGYSKVIKTNINYPPPRVDSSRVEAGLPEIVDEVRETSPEAKRINILLGGYGGSGHSGGSLMDAIILVSVNLTDKKASVISIPRDLWFSGHKINSDPSIKDALADITGLPVSHFISIDFNSFIKMIDSLGGIDVDVKRAYTDNFYPVKGLENEICGMNSEQIAEVHQKYSGFELEKQFTCRYETLRIPQGRQQMDGATALKYVRSRHGGSDFERSRHQFEVLKAILQKGNIKSVSSALDFVNTNLTLASVEEILTEIGNPLDYSVSYLGLSEENILVSGKSSGGAYILQVKEGQSIKEYINKNL